MRSMPLRLMLLTSALTLAVLAASQPVAASDRGPALRDGVATEWSAAKKKKRHAQYVYVRRAPEAGYVRRPWADPSFDEYGRPYRNPYPPNECSVDEGYGRFSPCTFRD